MAWVPGCQIGLELPLEHTVAGRAEEEVPAEHFPPEVTWCPTSVYEEVGPVSQLLRPLLSGELAHGSPQAKGGKTTGS